MSSPGDSDLGTLPSKYTQGHDNPALTGPLAAPDPADADPEAQACPVGTPARVMDQNSGCGSLGESGEKGGGPWEMEGVVGSGEGIVSMW